MDFQDSSETGWQGENRSVSRMLVR